MKVLTRNKDNLSTYITDATIAGDEKSIVVSFGDKSKIRNVKFVPENIARISEIMENQVSESLDNYGYFNRRRLFYGTGSAVCGAVSLGIIPVLNSVYGIGNDDLRALTIAGIGVVTTAVMLKNAIVNGKKVSEIDKFRMRESLRDELDGIANYATALNGVRSSVVDLIENTDAPFDAINSDSYTTKDLEKISENIEREKVLKLTYVKDN